VIDITLVQALVSPEIFKRGRDYVRAGAVGPLVRRGDLISTDVEGSEAAPYRVTIRMSGEGVADATCTCAYDWGDHCKHVAAALICLAERPDDVITRKPLKQTLSTLDRDLLEALVLTRCGIDESYARWLEAEIELASMPTDKSAAGRKSLVDRGSIKDYANALVAGRYRPRRHWDDFQIAGSSDELQRLVAKATPFLERGDGRNALRVLEAVTDAFVDSWINGSAGADDEMHLLLDDLGRLIAEAALLSDLSADERDTLAETVEHWHARVSDYGVEEAFPVAIRALEDGWDDPTLQYVLRGKTKALPNVDEPIEQALLQVRLHVLKACERRDEYLHLSRAGGAHSLHAAMLAEMGQLDNALAYARKRFRAASEAHDFAKALRMQAQDAAAIAIAEFGLTVSDGKKRPTPPSDAALSLDERREVDFGATALAHWLRDYAGAMGNSKVALKAAMFAFSRTRSKTDYRAAELWAKTKGAGKSWANVRIALLKDLQQATYASDRVAILMDECMIDEAVQAAGPDGGRAGDTDTLMRLALAAADSHSDWVIHVTRRRAETIINEGRSSHYADAAHWLEIAANAYIAKGHEAIWRALLEGLIETHKRKHKLRPLLERLRKSQ
jgi:uncharacterized Zn finger protein